jgi:chromosome segregation ATPase
MPFDLWGVLVPVVASTLILVIGAWAVRRYAGPAATAYSAAVEGRLRVLQVERDELAKKMTDIEAEVKALRGEVDRLERQVLELLAENRELRLALPKRTGARP